MRSSYSSIVSDAVHVPDPVTAVSGRMPEGWVVVVDGPLGPELELPGLGQKMSGIDLGALRSWGYVGGYFRQWEGPERYPSSAPTQGRLGREGSHAHRSGHFHDYVYVTALSFGPGEPSARQFESLWSSSIPATPLVRRRPSNADLFVLARATDRANAYAVWSEGGVVAIVTAETPTASESLGLIALATGDEWGTP
jgi:hypothetical protein